MANPESSTPLGDVAATGASTTLRSAPQPLTKGWLDFLAELITKLQAVPPPQPRSSRSSFLRGQDKDAP